MVEKLVRKLLTICLLTGSFTVTAQPGLWRIGFQAGTANTRSDFTVTPAIAVNDQINVTTPVGTWWQANVERSIASHLSLKAGLGRMRLPYTISTYSELRDASGRVLLTTGGASGGGDTFTYATLGLTANSPAWGPIILTAGIDLNLRYNRQAQPTFV